MTTKQEEVPRGHGMSEELFDSYLEDEAKLPKLTDKVVAITGTTTGLGFHLARVAIVKGARAVLLLNRTSERSKKSQEDLIEKYKTKKSTTIVQTIPVDLMDLSSVPKCAAQINSIAAQHGGLDVLCCNAGIMMMSDQRTKDGFEIQMQTNQISHTFLMHNVWESLEMAAEKRGEARVVLHSSTARHSFLVNMPMDPKFFEQSKPMTLGGDKTWVISQLFGWNGPISRYHQSKLANSAFAMALHHKLQESSKYKGKIKAMACEPGYSVTPLQTTSEFMPSWAMAFPTTNQSAADGCLNAAMCCFSPEAESGDLYGPANGMVGPPIKTISAGQPVEKGKEKDTCNTENQRIVWEGCEAASGVKFSV